MPNQTLSLARKARLGLAAGISAAMLAPALVTLVLAPAAVAKTSKKKGAASSFKGLLGNASDSALDQLSKPGAFYADEAVRVLLPGPLRRAGDVLRFTRNAGLTGDLTRSINEAAGKAAEKAKPIFRASIDRMTLADGVSIVTGGGTAGSDYLKRTAGGELRNQIRPLVASALKDVGAFDQLDKLGGLGAIAMIAGVDLSHDGLTDSVSDQAINGIFTYMGREETKFRQDPLGKAGKVLDGLGK